MITKIYLCIIYLLFFKIGLNQVYQSDNSIIWGKKIIVWSDFQGNADKNSLDEAHLSYSLEMNGRYKTKDSLYYNVTAIFNKSESWTKNNSNYILEHERLHFDISELYARKIRKKLTESYFTESTLLKEVNEIYVNYKNELRTRQKNYDSETNHSINKVQQEIWDKKIQEELLKLKMYLDTQVLLNVKWRK